MDASLVLSLVLGVALSSSLGGVDVPFRHAPEAKISEALAALASASARDALAEPGTPAFEALRTDATMIAEIKANEDLRLTSYVGASGHILIGYGHLVPNGKLGMRITEAEAERLLRQDLADAERYVRALVTRPIRQREFSALVDYAYNSGAGRLRDSEMLERFNRGNRRGAADAFLTAGVYLGPKNNRRYSRALFERRRVARAHFLGLDPDSRQAQATPAF